MRTIDFDALIETTLANPSPECVAGKHFYDKIDHWEEPAWACACGKLRNRFGQPLG